MLDEILNKHVMLSLSNGNVIRGFIVDINETHCKVIEPNNSFQIVRLDHISSVKLGGKANVSDECVPKSLKKEEMAIYTKNNEDLSMPLYNENQKEEQVYGNPFLGIKL